MPSTNSLCLALPALFILGAMGVPAMAQDSGGVRLSHGLNGGPVGLARPMKVVGMPLLTARDVQNGMTAVDHQSQNQSSISGLRGDAGFLGGFGFGSALASSRQSVQSGEGFGHHHGGARPIIINNTGPLAVTTGNNNLVQQQSASGPGPIAQQQVATVGGHSSDGGATNLVGSNGNIVQRAPN
jgi:hypothetical protein